MVSVVRAIEGLRGWPQRWLGRPVHGTPLSRIRQHPASRGMRGLPGWTACCWWFCSPSRGHDSADPAADQRARLRRGAARRPGTAEVRQYGLPVHPVLRRCASL